MKCAAPVREAALEIRASRDTTRRCQREGKILLSGKWFCTQHAPAWSVHYSIVERIRGFKNRDILEP